MVCAVFSYANLYRTTGNTDLFVAASVFLAPMVVLAVGAMVSKLRLMRRRMKQRRPDAIARARTASGLTAAARRAILRMLMERFLLQHDQLVFNERKSANDARRYECYGYLLGILSEVRIGSSLAHSRL